MPADTTVYISADDLRGVAQSAPLPEEFNDRDLLEAFVLATLDFSLSDGFDVAGSVSEMSTEVLKMRAMNVLLAAQNNPDYRATLMNGARLNEVSSLWRLKAANSSTGSGSVAAAFMAQSADEELSAARSLMQNARSQEEFLFGAVKYGSAAGKIFGFLGTILSVGEGLYTGVADDTFKGTFSSLLSGVVVVAVSAAIGLSVLVGWEFVAAAALVAVIGYAVSKFGEAIWDSFLSDIVWDTLDALGVGDGIREAFAEASRSIFGNENAIGEDYPVKLVYDGQYFVQGDEIRAYGGDGNDTFTSNWGRAVFLGGIGNDTYTFTTGNLRGNQTIVDSDGQGSVVVDGVALGEVATNRVSDSVWLSSDGNLRFSVVEMQGVKYLVVESIGSGSRFVVNDWENGDLGISLTGDVPVNSGDLLSNVDDLFGQAGSNDGNNVISSLAGNDGLSGGTGDDRLDGGAGDDLIFGFSGEDKLYGGDGNDYLLDGSESVDMREWREDLFISEKTEKQYNEDEITRLGASIIMRGKAWYVFQSGVNSDTIAATSNFSLDPNQFASGDDLLDGGAGNDTLRAGEGNDILIGGTGNDVLDGGHDDDILNGGDDNDSLYGDANENAVAGVHFTLLVSGAAQRNGNDILDGGLGDDYAEGDGGDDIIYGGAGDDNLRGRGENRIVDTADADSDYVDGGDGNDQISGDDGDDTLLGGAGADLIRGDLEKEDGSTRSGNDNIDGGDGDDTLMGDGGDDIVMGGQGADTISGDYLDLAGDKHGNDLLAGGDGNDIIAGFGGNDVIRGDAGDDNLQGDYAETVLSLEFHGDDQIYGGTGNDAIWGGGGNDVLDGGADDDQISGDAGDDTLIGAAGADILKGNDGNDNLRGDSGDDNLSGDAGDDQISGGEGADQLLGGAGNDSLDGGAGNDNLSGGDGNDSLYGGIDNDRLWGEGGNDALAGSSGFDQLVGGDGSDRLNGGDDDDTLFGETGDDTLSGDAGDDSLVGGAGNDVYLFNAGWGNDVLFSLDDADAGQDVVRFGAGVDPADLVVTIDSDGNLRLANAGGVDSLVVVGFFNNTDATHRIEFFDGTVWTVESLAQRFRPQDGSFNGTAAGNQIVGNSAGNVIDGDIGDDTLLGGSGNDVLRGGMGDDYSGMASDNDLLIGGDGADEIYGERGNDRLDGGSGNDKLNGGMGADTLAGGAGDDELAAGGWFTGGGSLIPDESNDVLEGGAGNDALSGGLGTNLYLFGAGFGNDRVYLAGEFNGSSALETAKFRFSEEISANQLSLSRVGMDLVVDAGQDSITVVDYFSAIASLDFEFSDSSTLTSQQRSILETRIGSLSGETIVGSSLNETLMGLGGDDILKGNGGDDVLEGGTGFDTLSGGAGNDIYRFGLNSGADDILDTDAVGNDTVELGAGVVRADVTFANSSGQTYLLIESTGARLSWRDGGVDRVVFADGTVLDSTEISAISQPLGVAFQFTGNGNLTGNKYANDFNSSLYDNSPTTAYGGAGDDRYFLRESSNFTVVENANEGNDTVFVNEYNYTLTANVENLVARYNNSERDPLNGGIPREFKGNALDNVIDASGTGSSLARKNRLDGGLGADILIGSSKQDFFVVDNVGDIIIETSGSMGDTVESWIDFSIENRLSLENLTLLGDAAINAIGNAADNILDGSKSSGVNILEGKGGNDTYRIGSQDVVVEQDDGGIDHIEFVGLQMDVTPNVLASNVENGTLLGYAEGLSGNELANALYGNERSNVIDGGAGDDIMRGLSGNDIYYVDSEGDSVIDSSGYDAVISSANFVSTGGIEVIQLTNSAISATGDSGSNAITGNNNANVLTGASGDDNLDGGLGSDIYVYGLGDGNDIIQEAENVPGETDVLRLGTGISLNDLVVTRHNMDIRIQIDGSMIDIGTDANRNSTVEQIQFSDGSSILIDDLINDAPYVANWIPQQDIDEGQSFSLTLPSDLFWNDPGEPLSVVIDDLPSWLQYDGLTRTFSGTPGAPENGDHEVSITATDTAGQAASFWLGISVRHPVTGTSGADSLASTPGLDVMRGGLGDDTYTINSSGDLVVENANEGNDHVTSSVSYWLNDNIERLTLTGTASIDGDGNELANTLTGNSGVNELYGYGGNDLLDGKGGADYMDGGSGDDSYVVDNVGDEVREKSEQEYDQVSSSVTYTLPSNVEALTLTGSSAINGTGNELDNQLIGNSGINTLTGLDGNDVLDGKAGADKLKGGLGDDTYFVDNTGDALTELANQGFDTVKSTVTFTLASNLEYLQLIGTAAINGTGNALDNVLTGNSGTNSLTGAVGNDTLDGAAGTDTLTGSAGSDTYLHGRGYGADTAVENDATAGVTDVARFLTGVSYDQLWFAKPSGTNHLEISIIGTSDKLTIKDWYLGTQYRVEEIRTVDGNYLLTAANVQTLVTKMATMTKPTTTTLSASQRSQLESTFASTWVQQQSAMAARRPAQEPQAPLTTTAFDPQPVTAPVDYAGWNNSLFDDLYLEDGMSKWAWKRHPHGRDLGGERFKPYGDHFDDHRQTAAAGSQELRLLVEAMALGREAASTDHRAFDLNERLADKLDRQFSHDRLQARFNELA